MSQSKITTFDTSDDLEDVMGDGEVAQVKQKTVSGALSYMTRSVFLYSLGIATSLLLAAYLSAQEFGIYGVVTQVVGILQFFATVGLGPTLIQKKLEPTVQEYRSVFTLQQMLSWVIFLIALLLSISGILTPKLGSNGIWILLALAFSFPLDSLRIIPAIILERKLNFSRLVFPSIVEQVVYNMMLIVGVLYFQMGVIVYAYAVLMRGIVGVVAMYSVQTWSFGWYFDKKTFRSLLSTGIQFQMNDFLARVKDQLFFLLLGGVLLPLNEFGYITWAKSWSQLPYLLTVQNVIAITFPTYSRLQHQPKLLKKAIEKTMYFVCLLIFPMLTGMAVFIYPFVQMVEKYHKWQPAVLTFILFTFSIGWAAISTPLTNTLNAVGKISQTLKLMVFWTVLTWTLTPVLLFKFGFNGVAMAAFIISFTSIIPIYLVKKIVDIQVIPQVLVPLISSITMAMVGILGQQYWQTSFLWLVIGMGVSSSTYILCVFLIGREQLYNEVRSLRSK